MTNPLIHLILKVAREQLTPQEQTALRDGLTRTCDNCAQSVSKDPKCGLCVGATADTTRWEPKNSPTT